LAQGFDWSLFCGLSESGPLFNLGETCNEKISDCSGCPGCHRFFRSIVGQHRWRHAHRLLNNKAGTTITPNQSSANVFNFRISEDLGGGLKAMAMTQRRFDATNGAERNESGAAGNAAGFHLAVVSLAGGFGQIDLGRIGLDQNWGYNPFGSNGAHVNPITFAGATQNGQWRYTLPTLVAGLKLSVAGAVQGNNAGAEADSQQLLATYATGPLSVTVVSEKVYGNQVGGVGANSGGASPLLPLRPRSAAPSCSPWVLPTIWALPRSWPSPVTKRTPPPAPS